MRHALAIAKKDLTVYLTTPLAWVIVTAVTVISSLFFLGLLDQFIAFQAAVHKAPNGWSDLGPEAMGYRNLTDGVVINLWSTLLIVTLFVVPFLSMRLFAEERQQRTFQLLMTTPVRPMEIVLGKYLGALGVLGLTLGVTLVYPAMLSVIGQGESGSAVEWSTVMLGFGGTLLFGSTLMAIGMFASSLTESQLISALVTFAVALGWMLLGSVVRTPQEPLHSIVAYLSFDQQLQSLMKGVLDLRPIVFFGSIIALFLLLTHRSLEAQRWG
jgi:ABC-2 type transport system permease protein